jgi:L-threonate 2-dehydrogenase
MSEARVAPRGAPPGALPGTPPARVGFIGLGRMGAPMCRHLLRAGHVLTVHNRTPARAAGPRGRSAGGSRSWSAARRPRTRALPFLRAYGRYGRTVARMGDVGAGATAKLVNQLLTFVHGAAAAEALALAERVGLDLAALGEVLGAGFGQSRLLERTLGRVRAGDLAAGAALRRYEKDLGLLRTVADEVGAPLPVTEAAREGLARAMGHGLPDHDVAALILAHRRARTGAVG